MSKTVQGAHVCATRYNMAAGVGIFLLLAANMCFSETYKCKDEKGRTIYSDAVCEYGAAPLKLHESLHSANQTADEIDDNRVKGAVATNRYTGKCSFTYSQWASEKTKRLSAAARDECYKNEILRESGRGGQVSNEAYQKLQDHKEAFRKSVPPIRTLNCTPTGFGSTCWGN